MNKSKTEQKRRHAILYFRAASREDARNIERELAQKADKLGFAIRKALFDRTDSYPHTLIALAEEAHPDWPRILIVPELRCLGYGQHDQSAVRHRLYKQGYRIIPVEKAGESDPIGELITVIHDLNCAGRSWKEKCCGLDKREIYKAPNGLPIYGYRSVGGLLMIDEGKAGNIIKVFDAFSKEMTPKEMGEQLFDEEQQTGPTTDAARKILRCKDYCAAAKQGPLSVPPILTNALYFDAAKASLKRPERMRIVLQDPNCCYYFRKLLTEDGVPLYPAVSLKGQRQNVYSSMPVSGCVRVLDADGIESAVDRELASRYEEIYEQLKNRIGAVCINNKIRMTARKAELFSKLCSNEKANEAKYRAMRLPPHKTNVKQLFDDIAERKLTKMDIDRAEYESMFYDVPAALTEDFLNRMKTFCELSKLEQAWLAQRICKNPRLTETGLKFRLPMLEWIVVSIPWEQLGAFLKEDKAENYRYASSQSRAK